MTAVIPQVGRDPFPGAHDSFMVNTIDKEGLAL